MLLITIYEEKIEDPMRYISLVRKSYNAGLDVSFIDQCQKNTFSYIECEKLVMNEINNIDDTSEEIEIESEAGNEAEIESEIDKEESYDVTPSDVADIEITQLKSVNKSLKNMLDENMKELEQLQTELFTLKKELFTYKNDITSYETKVEMLTKENKDLSLNKRIIEKRLDNIQNQCNILKRINVELSESAEEIVEDKSNELESRINELEQQNENFATDKKEIERKYQELYVEHMNLSSKYNELKEENNNKVSQYDDIDISIENQYMDIEELDGSADDEIDYDETDVVSMILDDKIKDEITVHRSIFAKLINKFRDHEFTHMPFHEQQGKIFTRMMKLDFPKDTIKLVSSTLNSNKDKVSLDLYHMVERNATPEECEMYCNSFNVA